MEFMFLIISAAAAASLDPKFVWQHMHVHIRLTIRANPLDQQSHQQKAQV